MLGSDTTIVSISRAIINGVHLYKTFTLGPNFPSK